VLACESEWWPHEAVSQWRGAVGESVARKEANKEADGFTELRAVAKQRLKTQENEKN
jgi:hypothetical protein